MLQEIFESQLPTALKEGDGKLRGEERRGSHPTPGSTSPNAKQRRSSRVASSMLRCCCLVWHGSHPCCRLARFGRLRASPWRWWGMSGQSKKYVLSSPVTVSVLVQHSLGRLRVPWSGVPGACRRERKNKAPIHALPTPEEANHTQIERPVWPGLPWFITARSSGYVPMCSMGRSYEQKCTAISPTTTTTKFPSRLESTF